MKKKDRKTHNNGALLAVIAVELRHLLEGKVANDVRVEHEERLVRVRHKLRLCEPQGPRGAQGLALDRVGDGDTQL